MKKKFTFLIAAAFMLLTMMASTGTMWGQTRDEVVVYTLDGTQTVGSAAPYNAYASASEVTQNDITWQVYANTTMSPWRIGGKSLTNVERLVYSTNPIADNISKIDVEHGTATDITVNSWTVIVATDESFESIVSTITPTFTASTTTTINRPDGVEWSNCYYKFIYNVTVSADKNKFIEFKKAEFYKETGTALQDSDLSLSPTSLSFDLYNDANAKTINISTSSTGTITVSNNAHVNTVVNGVAAITVTPVSVTSEAQTITVSQAADNTYQAGQETFTVSIANSTPTYTVTYKANGGTGDDVVDNYYEGNDVMVRSNPFVYTGHAFTKWNTAANGSGTDYQPGATIEDIQANIVLHAQWEESNEVVDVLTNSNTIGETTNNYSDWTATGTSEAEYSGNSAGGNGAIQFRSNNNNSGVVSTTSGGLVKKVAVTWNSNTQSGRTLNVYGKNTAYTAASDLYGDNAGTSLGTIVCGTSTELTINDDYEFIGMRSASGAMYLDQIQITWEPDEDPAVATTVTIDATNLTNTDVYTSTAAGSLSATVKAGDTPINGASVTWSSSNTAAATIDENGVVTLVAVGSTTITASYAGITGTYKPSSATYNLTVINSNAPGTENNPYTVAQARAAIDAGTGVTGVYVTGIVYEGGSSLSSGSMNYWISDDGTATDKFEIYKGKSFSGNNFTSTNEVQSGDIVVVYGNITKYSSTYEFSSGSRLHSLKLVAPSFSPAAGAVDEGTEVTISDLHTDATIYYTTDGSTPTNESAAYDDPIEITSSMTIKAIAVKSGCTNSNVVIAAYTIEEHAATPTFSPASNVVYTTAQNVTISCETEGATIYYTIDGTTPTNESTVYSSAIPVSVTTTIKAIAVKAGMANSSVAEATYNISLTTMDAIFAKATAVGSTATSVYITFNNWVITGVNNSKHAFLSDGEKGCMIYVDNHGGFSEGDILSGTANCNVQLFNASAELTNITTTTEGLTVTPGSSPTPRVTTIDALGAINTGSLVTLKDLTYNGSTLSDGVNTITPYNTIYSATLTNGKTYDVTGVFVLNNTTKRINPRREADIVLKADMSATVFSGLTAFTYLVDNGPSAAQHIELYGEDFAGNLTVTASGDYEVSTDNTTYSESVVVAHDEGVIAEDLYVRLKSGLATGDHNGTLTFTATNLTTVEQALEGTVYATPLYTITLNQTTGGTISADKETAEEGETVTLSVVYDDDCTIVTAWTVLDGLANPIAVSNNQFTMPASDVEVEATFGTKSFTISYSVNGVIEDILEEDVDCGDNAPIYTAGDLEGVVEFPTGFTLAGWSTSAGSSATVASFTPTADATLYAVLIQEGSTISYVKITSLSDITEGTYFIVNDGYVLPSATTGASTAPAKTDVYEIEQPLEDSYNSLPVAGTEWIFTGTKDEMTIKNSEGKYLYATNNNNGLRVHTTADTWSFENHPNEGTGHFAMKEATNNRYCASYSGGSDWRSYSSADHTNYGDEGILYLYKKEAPHTYTNVLVEDLTGNVTITEPTYIPAGTIVDAGAYTITTNPEDLILEDGAQLIHTAAVNATVQKGISAYTAKDGNGWYLIASPVETIDKSVVAGTTYDLFLYSEPDAMWYAHWDNPGFQTLNRGQGYLYANAADKIINYAGTMIATNANINIGLDYTSTLSDAVRGFNLVGNPFTRNLVLGDMKLGGANLTTYYVTNTDRTALQAITSDAYEIKPGEGFFVQATPASQQLSFNASSKDDIDFRYIKIVAGNENGYDNAYIQMGDCNTLRKMNIANKTEVYVMAGEDDYAAARVEELEGSMPVNFKAIADGEYTITVEAKYTDVYYMHLIDSFTGEDIDLMLEPSYTFQATTQDAENRFLLVFDFNNHLGVNENYTNNIFAYQYGDEIIINGEGELQIFDVMGRMVLNTNVNGVQSFNVPSNGVYILRIIGNGIKTQKIVVK